jgi:hypothetical protein
MSQQYACGKPLGHTLQECGIEDIALELSQFGRDVPAHSTLRDMVAHIHPIVEGLRVQPALGFPTVHISCKDRSTARILTAERRMTL